MATAAQTPPSSSALDRFAAIVSTVGSAVDLAGRIRDTFNPPSVDPRLLGHTTMPVAATQPTPPPPPPPPPARPETILGLPRSWFYFGAAALGGLVLLKFGRKAS